MKPTSPALRALLTTRQFFVADLYTFDGVGGNTTLRYCGGDSTISANGFIYPAGGAVGPYFDRNDDKAVVHSSTGTQVDTLTFDILPGTSTILGIPFLTAVGQGVFDGASMTLERAFMPTYGNTSAGTIQLFSGRIGDITDGRSVSTFSVNSWLELLNLQWPRNLWQPGCMNNLGDGQCQAVIPSVNGTVSGSPSSTFLINGTLAAGSYNTTSFNLGTITFTSGVNDGMVKTIKTAGVFGTAVSVQLVGWLPNAPAAGDTFTLTYGCDHTYGNIITVSCNTFSGVNWIEASNGTGLSIGMAITGTGIAASSNIDNIEYNVPSTANPAVAIARVYMNHNATSTNTAVSLNFQAVNGCAKFSNADGDPTNQKHFRGAPFIPQPQAAI